MNPKQLTQFMNEIFTFMTQIVYKHRGTIDKYIGDAIMGVFGAPEKSQDHAEAACKAALESRDHLKKLNEKIREEWGITLRVRIGVNSDKMIVGNFGSARKKDYTVPSRTPPARAAPEFLWPERNAPWRPEGYKRDAPSPQP